MRNELKEVGVFYKFQLEKQFDLCIIKTKLSSATNFPLCSKGYCLLEQRGKEAVRGIDIHSVEESKNWLGPSVNERTTADHRVDLATAT